MSNLDALLRAMTERGASDLHLKPTRPPLIRVTGKLFPLEQEPVSPEEIQAILDGILQPHQKKKLEERMSVDFGYGVSGLARFRANVYSTSATCPWAWCWSRARPEAASRRPWPR